MFKHPIWICSVFMSVLLLSFVSSQAADKNRPNILWITSEDNSPYLGCYGDVQAKTPNLDRFSTQGIRYRNAFSSAPVCSAARSTLISGMHASSAGLHNHRSSNAIPAAFKLYPESRIVSPDKVKLPPYHADTPVIRENWSRYYDNIWPNRHFWAR